MFRPIFRRVTTERGVSGQQDGRALDALYRVSSLVGETEDPAVALEGILDEVMRTFDASSASIALLNPTSAKLLLEVERGFSEEAKGFELPVGKGITGWVALHGEAVLAPRVEDEPRYFPLNPDVKSEMCAPLMERGRPIGVLNVDSFLEEAFDESDLRLLSLLANEAGRVLENTWFIRQLRRKAEQLQSFVQVGREVAGKREVEEVLRTIGREALELMGCRFSALFLYDSEEDLLRLHSLRGSDGSLELNETLRPSDSILGSALRGLRQVQESDLFRTEEHHFTHLIRDENLCSMLATPLVYEKKAIGVLSVYLDKAHRFNDDELLVARALADLGALAIENARLYGIVLDTEESLRKSERLTTLGMLAAEIAHEIRNPLMVLRLLFDSVRTGVETDGEAEKDLSVIREKLDHLEQIAGRILDFGKNREAVRTDLFLAELLEDVARLVRIKMVISTVELEIGSVPPDLVVSADKGQLQQAMLNLILNALAAMPEGGSLSISVDLSNEGKAMICIKDSGLGISEGMRSRIFETFLTGNSEGVGLGLAISKRILRSHEGDLELVETGTEGTTFRLTLPLATP